MSVPNIFFEMIIAGLMLPAKYPAAAHMSTPSPMSSIPPVPLLPVAAMPRKPLSMI